MSRYSGSDLAETSENQLLLMNAFHPVIADLANIHTDQEVLIFQSRDLLGQNPWRQF